MADMYAYLIMKGRRTYKSVPNCLKERVKKILVELGLGELATEEE